MFLSAHSIQFKWFFSLNMGALLKYGLEYPKPFRHLWTAFRRTNPTLTKNIRCDFSDRFLSIMLNEFWAAVFDFIPYISWSTLPFLDNKRLILFYSLFLLYWKACNSHLFSDFCHPILSAFNKAWISHPLDCWAIWKIFDT